MCHVVFCNLTLLLSKLMLFKCFVLYMWSIKYFYMKELRTNFALWTDNMLWHITAIIRQIIMLTGKIFTSLC